MTELSTNMCRELAHRVSAGIDVTLIWVHANDEDRAVVVCVCDMRDGAYFEIQPEPDRALEVYYHPFAYRGLSFVDDDDGRLAA